MSDILSKGDKSNIEYLIKKELISIEVDIATTSSFRGVMMKSALEDLLKKVSKL